jgi:hypothetical protein
MNLKKQSLKKQMSLKNLLHLQKKLLHHQMLSQFKSLRKLKKTAQMILKEILNFLKEPFSKRWLKINKNEMIR